MKEVRLKNEKSDSSPSRARVATTAVNMLTSTPRIRVKAKPLG